MILLLASLLMAQEPGRPQVSAELLPSPARTGENIYLRINVKVQGAPASGISIEAPALPPELQVVRTQDSHETSVSVPGGRTATMQRVIVMRALAPGDFTIPPIRVTIEGSEIVRTGALQLRVDGSAEVPPERNNREARLLVHMQPETVYVGQQSTLVGEVLLSPELQLRLTRPPSYEAPSPADFWIQELNAEPRTDLRVLGPERYVVQRFYRAYFPLTVGQYAFAPARVTYEARQGFIFAPQTRELRSQSPRLIVLPLPDAGRPDAFSGAVGALQVSASIEPAQAAVGDAVVLTVEISGTGNVKALPPPDLSRLSGMEVLDPAEASEVTTEGRLVQGTKRFTWVLVPERPGRLEIPPIEYSSFDPAARAYRTYHTEPLQVDVVPASAAGTTRSAQLRRSPAGSTLGFVTTPRFAAAQFLPVLLILGAAAFGRRRTGPPRQLQRAWKQRISVLAALKPINPAALEQLLRDALYTLWPLPIFRSGTVQQVRAAASSHLPDALAERIGRLLDQLESIRYAPNRPDSGEVHRLLRELQRILNDVWKHAARSSKPNQLLPVVAFALQTALPQDAFDRGVAAYDAHRVADAVVAFDAYARAHPRDAAGWYNLGVAYQSQRAPARAAYAFLHALQLEPRSGDIRDQLHRVGIDDLARRVAPATRLTTPEVLGLGSLLWWISALLLAAAFLRHDRRFAFAAAAPLSLAGLLFIAWGIERALPPPAIVLDQGVSLLATQSLHSEPIRQLQPLAGLSVIEEADGWLRVRTGEGEEGWVSADAVGVVGGS